MPEMIEVQIDSIRVHLMQPQRLVILKEKDAERYLPIWVGMYEAEAITLALQEVEVVRPLTHDLLKNVFGAFNARIKRVEIVNLSADIFFGNIVAEADGREIHVDSRPSDALALAVRAHAPILVHESVMNSASIMPEQEVAEGSAGNAALEKQKPVPFSEEGSERLSVFEDFLGKLDLDNLDNKDKPDEEDKPDRSDKPSKPDKPDKSDKPKKPKKK
jgi:bifunctional DNase/RNase